MQLLGLLLPQDTGSAAGLAGRKQLGAWRLFSGLRHYTEAIREQSDSPGCRVSAAYWGRAALALPPYGRGRVL